MNFVKTPNGKWFLLYGHWTFLGLVADQVANWAALEYGLTLQHSIPRIKEQITLFARYATILKIMIVPHVWRITLIMKWPTAQREVRASWKIIYCTLSVLHTPLAEENEGQKSVVFCRFSVLVANSRFPFWGISFLLVSDLFILKHSILIILSLILHGALNKSMRYKKNDIYVEMLELS